MRENNAPTPSSLRSKIISSVLAWRVTPWLVLVASLIISLWVWQKISDSEHALTQARFDALTMLHRKQITERLGYHERMLKNCAGLFYASETVTRNEWFNLFQAIEHEKNYPGVLGIGFAQLVSPADKTAHIQKIRAEGFPQYNIWPEGEREEYTSIVFLEPFKGRNLRAFGFDMFSESVRRTAMEKARDTGEAALSGKVTLVQETSDAPIQNGFLMYVPVYSRPLSGDTVAERRKALRGYVYSPFRAGDFFEAAIHSIGHEIDFSLFDGSEEDFPSLLFDSTDCPDSGKDFTGLSRKESIEVCGRKWTVKFFSQPKFQAKGNDQNSSYVLVCSIALSFLLSAFAFTLASRQRVSIRAARLAAIVAGSNDAIIDVRLDGRIENWNSAATRLFGNPITEVRGKLAAILFPPDAQNDVQMLMGVINRGESLLRHVTRMICAKGEILDVAITLSSIRNPGDQVVGASIIARDVSDLKATEKAQKKKTDELEKFNQAMLGREARVIELKQEVNRLSKELGRTNPYPPTWEEPVNYNDPDPSPEKNQPTDHNPAPNGKPEGQNEN